MIILILAIKESTVDFFLTCFGYAVWNALPSCFGCLFLQKVDRKEVFSAGFSIDTEMLVQSPFLAE